MEGAGVRLKRAFGSQGKVQLLDPFLLLDDFHSDDPDDYIAGFPRHPHRGIETVTYMVHGKVKHEDSLGNKGVIQDGDVQWMTAGSGIIHSEMPLQTEGMLRGLQLWVNLPAADKMMAPRYREVTKSEIPEVALKNGTKIKIISGEVEGTKGPVQNIVVESEYLDVSVPAGEVFEKAVKDDYAVFAYVLEGEGYFSAEKETVIKEDHLVIFGDGNRVIITAGETPVRFLLVSGKPLGEPVAWQGPIVMNTQEELRTAFTEYQNGTFIKHKK